MRVKALGKNKKYIRKLEKISSKKVVKSGIKTIAKKGLKATSKASSRVLRKNLIKAGEKGVGPAACHRTLHTFKYYDTVNYMLKDARSEEVFRILEDIKRGLLKGTFPY